MISITLLTLFIVYGQSTITRISFDNENNINGKYINPNVRLVLYLTAEMDTSSESVSIEIWEDVTFFDPKIESFTATIKNGINELPLSLTSSKYEELGEYYFKINSKEYDSRFYISFTTCPSSCSICSSSGTCQCNVLYCASSTCSTSETCSSCETNYKPYNGKCIKCTDSNCEVCSSENYCETCISGYKAINGKCTEETTYYGDPTGCNDNYNLVNCYINNYVVLSCDSCKSGYKRESMYTCQGTKTYCEKDTNAKCTDLDPNCKTCDTSNPSKCSNCMSGFEPNSNGQCRVEGSNSPYGEYDSCSGTTTTNRCADETIYSCSSCKSGYTEVSIYTTCSGVVTYCEKYEITCSDSKCTQCPSSSDYCTSCISGYTPKNGQCEKDQITCSDSKCTQCPSSSDYCSSCTYGYTPKNGKCVLIQDSSSQDSSSQDSSSQESYNIDHCEYYLTPFECESCVNGYYLDNNECKQKAICDVDNCKECKNTDSYKCEECNEGYHLYEGECISNECQVNNCYKCIESSSNICDECNSGYHKTNDYTCESNNICQISNCVDCYYDPYDNEHCNNCDKGYYLESNYCSKCESGCSKCSSYDYCGECELGYAVNNDGSCMEIPETTEYKELACDISDSCYSDLPENDNNYYSVTPNDCYNSDYCGKSVKIVNNYDSYYLVNYPERNCEGPATISNLYCEVNGSETIFTILVIILIAFF